jgi:hypothetical protein
MACFEKLGTFLSVEIPKKTIFLGGNTNENGIIMDTIK